MVGLVKKLVSVIVSVGAIVLPVHAALKVGDKAPLVSGPLSDGTVFQLSDWLDRAPLVLFFYPKNNTPGCTTEACSLRDDFSDFRHLKATVIGISYDSIESHRKFIEKYQLPFLLLSDEKKEVSKAFGVAGAFFADRATFIIGKDGAILYANPSVNPRTHSQEIRDVLKATASQKDKK